LRIYQIDPTKDPRWAELVQQHPDASIFHTVPWLEALRRTYKYEPIVFTTSSPTGALQNGLVFCHVDSWLTGSRIISLPFSDHCQPLIGTREDMSFLIRYLQTALDHETWKYLEVRSVRGLMTNGSGNGKPSATPRYFLHVVNLRPDLTEIFHKLDKDSVQRRITRARKANLDERTGTSNEILEDFYDLFTITRSRHQLPPIPYVWFENLIHNLGSAVQIRVASRDGQPIAAILTLRFRDILYYKYGGSDKQHHNLGATPWLLWNALAAAKSEGATAFDLGRTGVDNQGLLAFKNHWVSNPEPLDYWRFPDVMRLDSLEGWRLKAAKRVFAHMPDRLLALTGRLIYRHIG
jgi:hypothetical protein